MKETRDNQHPSTNLPANGSFAQPRILVADDDEASRAFLARGLRSAGYNVVLAGDGREAVAIVERAPVDAIVTDISMPQMTGIHLLRAIRGRDLIQGYHVAKPGRPFPVPEW